MYFLLQEDGNRRERLTSTRGDRDSGTSYDSGLNRKSECSLWSMCAPLTKLYVGGGVGGESGDGHEAGGKGDRTKTHSDDEKRHTGEGGERDSRNSSHGTGLGSRPHSTLGSRPGSSLQRGGLDHRTRNKKGAELKVRVW